MRRVILVLSLFFLFNGKVLAASAYLENLEIDSYNLSPNFDKYNNTYSINVSKEEKYLNISYKLEDAQAKVEVIGNDLTINKSGEVLINVQNDEEKQTYKILINQEDVQNVASLNNDLVELNVPKKRNMKLILIYIIIGWLILNIISHRLIFHKR